jgi:amino acid transporter
MKRAIFKLMQLAHKMKLRTEIRRALLSTLFLFGLLTWLYVVVFQMMYPDWLSSSLTHINVFPFNLRVDLTGIVAFVVSALAFFFLQLTPKREGGRETDH